MEIFEIDNSITACMKALAALLSDQIASLDEDKLTLHHASNAIKSLSNLRTRLTKRMSE